MAEILREDGTDPDYSRLSLEGLERILVRHRRPADEPSAREPDELPLLRARAGAYAAEAAARLPRGEAGAKMASPR
jgi:hypothetical protein